MRKLFNILITLLLTTLVVTIDAKAQWYTTREANHKISVLNSTSALLGTDSVFLGVWEDVSDWTTVAIAISGNYPVETGTLRIEVSHDGTTIHGFKDFEVPNEEFYDLPHVWNIVEKYFRVRYTNNNIAQTKFSLQTKYSNGQELGLLHKVGDAINDNYEGQIQKTVITAKTGKGEYQNVIMTPTQGLNVSVKSNQTAFGDLRVANLNPQFQASFEYTVHNSELYTIDSTGSGRVYQSDAMAVVKTDTTTGSSATLESKYHAKYRAGLGGILRFTALFSEPQVGTQMLVGLADEEGSNAIIRNGYVLTYIDTIFGIARYSNDTLRQFIELYNCDDPLDGSGLSGMIIDLKKLNVFAIQYGYLGAHDIKFFVEDIATGEIIQFHNMHYAGENEVPSVYNPNFHFRIEADNGATNFNVYTKTASYAYFVEGNTRYYEIHQPEFSTGEKSKTTVTTEVALLTIKNKATYAGKSNFVDIVLQLVTGSIESSATNNLGSIRLVKNATLGGSTSFTDINTTNSVVNVDVSGTTVTGGVEIITIPLAGKNDKFLLNLIDYGIILHPNETLTIAGKSTNASTINASIFWKELF